MALGVERRTQAALHAASLANMQRPADALALPQAVGAFHLDLELVDMALDVACRTLAAAAQAALFPAGGGLAGAPALPWTLDAVNNGLGRVDVA
jgi:hypothetical protein